MTTAAACSGFINCIEPGTWADWTAAMATVLAVFAGFTSYWIGVWRKRSEQAKKVVVTHARQFHNKQYILVTSFINGSEAVIFDPYVVYRRVGFEPDKTVTTELFTGKEQVLSLSDKGIDEYAARPYEDDNGPNPDLASYLSSVGTDARPIVRRMIPGDECNVLMHSPIREGFTLVLNFTDARGRRWTRDFLDLSLRRTRRMDGKVHLPEWSPLRPKKDL